MNIAIVLCAVFAVSLASNATRYRSLNKDHRRIVGGSETNIQAFPWQASFQSNSGGHVCGASIISKDYVVTAAHCVDFSSPSDYRIRVGVSNYNSPDGQTLSIEDWVQHPEWEVGPGTFPNDIAVIKLADEIVMNENVVEIEIADVFSNYEGDTCYISGWGRTCPSCPVPDILRAVEIGAYTNEECNEDLWEGNINDGHICLGVSGTNAGACFGDSGGPFYCEVDGRPLLAGVTSWGTSTCDAQTAPSVYSRVSHFSSWIRSVIQS